MALNQPMLYTALYAAFRKQSTKRGPGKFGIEHQMAMDISKAVDAFVRSGTVMTGTTDINTGIGVENPLNYTLRMMTFFPWAAPWPVFTNTTSTGIGTGVGKVV